MEKAAAEKAVQTEDVACLVAVVNSHQQELEEGVQEGVGAELSPPA